MSNTANTFTINTTQSVNDRNVKMLKKNLLLIIGKAENANVSTQRVNILSKVEEKKVKTSIDKKNTLGQKRKYLRIDQKN